ncbi:MAG: 50S ribosomal protein L25 [Firmicutes bacterium]|nr:50S ribosomal protein L25 [Bacillota bacterium]
MADINLEVEKRSKGGRATRNKLHKEGRIPGVMYGKEVDSMSLSVDAVDMEKILKKFGSSKIINLNLKGEAEGGHKVMVRDVQNDPIRGEISHVDFQKVSMKDKVKTTARIVLEGEPELTGDITVQQQLRLVDIECLPSEIPEDIKVDISNLGEGDVIHVTDLRLPDGVKVTSDPTTVVASATYLNTNEPETTPEEVEESTEEKDTTEEEEVKENQEEG